ncbi:hypothetical protein K458DRAFT_423390 [Lentithecium fluviatile CBS 122367]|uniref:Uncharacterized protein n=1 Tax=Lentithecium fluviatile CBS 122367 TaxID=1168545 RepID=A0A6G1IIZ4_9PLEO|nr:hypothetical protein K458DRAFT_423390 [Lentithecium fluviatile CBS 122367]
MAVSAVDIITYIGIPLAVLGVLPTIYTVLKSFLTLREITRTLHQNGVVAITRSALLTGIVEVEIPRRSIIPLDRGDPAYFSMRRTPSRLKGGTWTLFNWKEMVIGVKSYRLQYHDELSQPQAEIEFEALIAFLLDRGAVPYKEGWADLRSAGLWTPAGTRLLVYPGEGEEVLSVAISDDSDGILSVGMKWRPEWDKRGRDSVPPYWVRIVAPGKEGDVIASINEVEGWNALGEENAVGKKGAFLDDESAASEEVHIPSALRIRISAAGVQEAYTEANSASKLPLLHLRPVHPSYPSSDSTAGFWFSIAATALQAPLGGLWSFSIPAEILTLARHNTVPCGVMVLLGTLTDDAVPAWRTPHLDEQAERFEKHVKFVEQSRKVNEEMRLPLEQRDAARKKRMEAEAIEFHNDSRRRRMREEQRKEAETLEAIQSQKLPIARVCAANLNYLTTKLKLPLTPSTHDLLSQILYAMANDASFAARLATMLDLWKNWAQSGGMAKSHFLAVKEDQVTFALASVVLAVLAGMVSEPMGSVVGDLQECLRMWKKVRLG